MRFLRWTEKNRRTARFATRFLGGLAAAALAALALTANPGLSSDAPSYKGPRTADGKPNLNGIWQALNTANYDVEAHVAGAAMQLRSGPQGPVPAAPVLALGAVGSVPGGLGVVVDGAIPYKPEALEQRNKNRADWLANDPEIKCFLPGIPRANYMPYPFQILQGENSLFFAYEYAGATRNVFLKDPGPAPVDSWMGQSVGRWEGDTLVIEVTGQNDRTWFDRAGNYHTENMKVTERFTPRGTDHIQYEATIEDPTVFTKPWTIRMPLYRRVEPDAQIMDFKCVEFVEELMYGQYRKNPLPR